MMPRNIWVKQLSGLKLAEYFASGEICDEVSDVFFGEAGLWDQVNREVGHKLEHAD